ALPSLARSAAELLAVEVARAVQEGRITAAAARPVFLTRVVGFPVAEAAERLGCSPGVIRALRSRAERRLAA
ncbi:MAG: sigma factor-like helix-turn-helix DNA-binding protein, partial [Acidimicrobiales bacterium]